jgi:hypothetical protein
VLIFTCVSSGLLMKMEVERPEDAEDVPEAQDVNDDEGPSTPHDGNDVVPDTAKGHQGAADGN